MKKATLLVSAVIALVATAGSCKKEPRERTAFDKVYDQVREPENEYFWEQFHNGNIDHALTIISRLEQQYQADTTHLLAAAHLGFAHFWLLSEGLRSSQPVQDIPGHVQKAYTYFTKAYSLNPHDKRILGFLANAEMAYGNFYQSPPHQQQGFTKGLAAVTAWPEFNKFTMGVGLSAFPPQTDQYKMAMEWQWTTLEDCYTSPIDRSNPAIQPFLRRDMSGHNLGKDRACYNSWIAPHNIEGYFLHMGDMIVKAGDAAMGKKIYELAKASPDYNNWPFKAVLEKRIQQAERNTTVFLDPSQQGIDNVFIAASGSLCMSCHKMSDGDRQRFKNFDWQRFFKTNDIYSINGWTN